MTAEIALQVAFRVLDANPQLLEKWLDPKLRFESGTSGWLR